MRQLFIEVDEVVDIDVAIEVLQESILAQLVSAPYLVPLRKG